MAAEQPSDGYLFDLYRQYIGEPEDSTDVYIGFGVFLGGIGLAIVALVLFFVSSTQEAQSSAFFAWAEWAYAIGMIALPGVMLGIVVLLPAEKRVLYTSIAGVVITLFAVAGFVHLYPSDWNFYESGETAFSTVHVVGLYAVGLAGITASTGAALIAHYLEMARTVEALEEKAEQIEEEEQYSDAEIRDDIDAAMDGVELSWGGVEKSEHKRLTFSDHEFESENLEFNAKTTRSSGVDAQVAGLKGLKGGEKKTAVSSTTVDDQTQKLKELREQQRAKEAEEAKAEAAKKRANPFVRLIIRLRELVKRN